MKCLAKLTLEQLEKYSFQIIYHKHNLFYTLRFIKKLFKTLEIYGQYYYVIKSFL
jgi:hypothetical protein